MSDMPLKGRKIAVLVETEYVPSEIKAYQDCFAAYGAEVHLMSRLWGQPKALFASDVDQVGKPVETLEVTIDFKDVDLHDYAAVIQSANYTSVRLRWLDDGDLSGPLSGSSGRDSPAVQFMYKAMMDTRLVKGFPCHALWILTAVPETLAGRRIICNRVMLPDITNAGGVYTPSTTGIVVDGDMVTNDSASRSVAFVDVMKDRILAMEAGAVTPSISVANAPGSSFSPEPVVAAPQKRRILTILSEWGYWGEELVAPLEEFQRAGYQVDFCTPTGRRPNAIAVSMDPGFIDPPLGRAVTTVDMAAKVRAMDDPQTTQGKRLENPINLAQWFPERPYWSHPQLVRAMESYNLQLVQAKERLKDYNAMLIIGGSGPVVDLVNNQRVHDLILGFHQMGKAIAAECYGVACLAFARNIEDRRSILLGKRVTGHCLEYDYKDGTGFMKGRGKPLDFNMGPPPYPLEFILRDATGPTGAFIGNFGHPTSVVVDYPFITGRSTPDAYLTARKLIEVLDGDPPLRRWGW